MTMTPEQKEIWREWIKHEPADLKQLAKELAAQETLPFPLYHGSNTYALSLTQEQRSAIREACMCLVPYYYAVCEAAGFKQADDAEVRNLCGAEVAEKVMDALVTAERFCSGSKNYEYEATYLTSTVSKVAGYANRSWFCGELHDALHWLQQAAAAANAEMPAMTQEEQTALQLLEECEAAAAPEGVILRLDHVPRMDLISDESGNPIRWERTMYYFLTNTLQENYRAREGYPLSGAISVPLAADSLQALIEEEEHRSETLCREFEKRVFREAMLEKGFSPEAIQAFLERY